MKKILSLVFVLAALVVFTTVPASANASEALTEEELFQQSVEEVHADLIEMGFTKGEPITASAARAQIDVEPSVLKLAYSEIDESDPKEKLEILRARNIVAESSSGWYDDQGGIYAVKVDTNTMTWHEMPKYSELFPGWDLPMDLSTLEVSLNTTATASVQNAKKVLMHMSDSVASVNDIARNVIHYINAFIPKTVSGKFAYSYWEERIVEDRLTYLEVIQELTDTNKINLGVTNLSVVPNTSLYAIAGLELGQGIEGTIPRTKTTRAGFRGSCNANDATAKIMISLNQASG